MSIRKRWYVNFGSTDSSRQWSWSISRKSANVLLSILAVGLIICGFIVYNGWKRNSDLIQLTKMREENHILRERLIHFAIQMDSLLIKIKIMEAWEDELREDRRLRTVSPDIRAMGQGGEPIYDPVFLNYDIDLNDVYNENLQKLEFVRAKVHLTYQTHSDLIETLKSRDLTYRTTPSIWPTFGRVTDLFGYRTHPVFGYKNLHSGIDIANDRGTYIYSTANGTVTFAGRSGQSGNLIRIDHASGYQTRYAHLDRILVRQGDQVQKGQIIAQMGTSGVSTGSHLHYEVMDIKKNAVTDPSRFFNLREDQVTSQ